MTKMVLLSVQTAEKVLGLRADVGFAPIVGTRGVDNGYRCGV